MKNWHLKIGSLVAALFLAIFVDYFYTPTEFGTSVVQLTAPVEIRNVPQDKSVIWPATRQVEITLQGSSLFMSRVALSPPVVRVNLPETPDKKFIAKLTADNVSLPATVRLLGIKPAELEFGIDDIVEKTVAVVVPQIGILSDELRLEQVLVEPAQVLLKGPSQELKGINVVETVPVNLAVLDRAQVAELELRTPWSAVEISARNVKVTIAISEATAETNFNNVPIILEVLDEQIKPRNPTLSQKVATVSLKGTKRVLKSIKKEALVLRAQITSESQISESLELNLDPIVGIDSLQILPKRVSFQLDPIATPTVIAKSKNSSKK